MTDGNQTFASVWDALEDTPESAANMTMRSLLMISVAEAVGGWGLSQTKAAARLNMTQPRLNDLLRGRIDRFSLDALIGIAGKAGLNVTMAVAAPDTAAVARRDRPARTPAQRRRRLHRFKAAGQDLRAPRGPSPDQTKTASTSSVLAVP